MGSPKYDIAIIGGGIVGLATAMALAQRGRRSIVVLETEGHVASHQTGHNSGVIHAGLYYKPGSLKAKNCVAGREALYRFCEQHNIAHQRCGKIVVATHEAELPKLAEIETRGQLNGLVGIKRLAAGELIEYEPHVRGVGGLWVPETGIINYRQVAEKYSEIVSQEGGEVKPDFHVRRVEKRPDELVLETSGGDIRADHLIACAGLQADRVAKMCGVRPGLQILPFRGEYYELVPERQSLVRNLIYPVPDPKLPFLGVHFTRMVGGGIEAGPNAVLALARTGYRWRDINLVDLATMLTYPGFWRMAARYWKTGLDEIRRSLSKRAFVGALRKLVPELQTSDVRRAGSGVRAQAVDSQGRLVDDFVIVDADRMIHVLNAPSPAATSSISIGQTIAERAIDRFDLN